ncbi:hypothetical protein Tco_0872351 [Tanacetum coccineum]
MNSLPDKWLTFSQRLRNANHTQTIDLADIYQRFVYEDNLIQRRYSDTKKALITTPSSIVISTTFFSNNVIQDFQENSDDEVNERSIPESQDVNESLEPTETLNTPESSKDSESESITPLPPLKNLQGASPSSESVSRIVTVSETDAVVIRDFYKKLYNSLGRVPNHCSSSIGKTRGLLSFSRGIGWEGFHHDLTKF